MNILALKLLINGSPAGAMQALLQVKSGAKATDDELKKLGKDPEGIKDFRKELTDLSSQLSSIRGMGGEVLKFAGIGMGIAEVIQLADAFHSMEGRLKLATQYSGDYSQVLLALRDSARATRSDLVATVDLYAKISTSLKAVGLNSMQAVGLVTTINKAISMSGTSAESAAAALMQLGQGLGAGALRGDEFNSVMEQAPGLAQAIADGLGIAIGSLRQWAEDGKLTAEVVATALQKSAQSVDANFARMPVTVGQSLTNLKNEFMVFIGMTDNASNSTSALANVINSVAQEIADAGPVVTAFAEFFKLLANGLDLSYRLLKAVGLASAGVAAAVRAALSGNLTGAKEIIADIGDQIDEIMQKPLVTETRVIDAAVDSTKKREQLEAQLAAATQRYEKLKEYEAGKVSDNIAAKEKANIDARIADQQRLVDAVRQAFQQSLAEAEKYAQAAQSKIQKATDYRAAGQSAAFAASISGLPDDQQAQAKFSRMQDLQSQGAYEAARARMAAMEGDVKKYDAAAAAAERKLKEALQLAQDVKDSAAIEDISNALAKVQESGAGLDNKKAAQAQETAQMQAKKLAELQAQLDAMTKEARTIEIKAEMTDAETKMKGLKAQLDELSKGTVVPVTVQQNGNAPTVQTPDVARAFGGPLPGVAPHDRADNMLYWGTPGEWVIQRPAVRFWGEEFIRAINSMRMPRFAYGGQLSLGRSSVSSRLAIPSLGQAAQQSSVPVVLDFGELGRYQVSAEKSTQQDLVRTLRRVALARGK